MVIDRGQLAGNQFPWRPLGRRKGSLWRSGVFPDTEKNRWAVVWSRSSMRGISAARSS
jgi:hypothetical protein